MEIMEQTLSIRQKTILDLNRIQTNRFLFQTAVSSSRDRQWYDRQLQLLDLLSSQINLSTMMENPRRLLRYSCAIKKCVSELEHRVEMDYEAIESHLLK